MLSAIVIIPAQSVRASARALPDALVRTLAAFVPATIEGVLRDLAIAAPAGHPELDHIADHAGCALIEATDQRAALLLALRQARENNIFVIAAGRAPETGFADEVVELIMEGRLIARMRERPDSFMTRLLPGLAPAAALLAPRDRLGAIAAHDISTMSRRLGRAATLRMRARRVD